MQIQNTNAYPLVSVLMCAYNVRPYIEQAVNCILNQTYPHFELIISDDGSSDGTREWLQTLKNHPQVKLYFQEKNIGYVANKNFLIGQATGEYITQNDSDDLSEINRLEKQVTVCLNNPDIKIVASGYNKIDAAGRVYQTIRVVEDMIYPEYNGEEYKFWFPPLLVHKDIYKQAGLFTSYFAGMGDDFYWTIKANELTPIYCLTDVLYSYRDNPNSITNVLDNNRKLIVPELLSRIIKQRKAIGTDWLEESNDTALRNLEEELLRNPEFMAERYRIWAAKSIDKMDWSQATRLLKKALVLHPFQVNLLRTILYFVRRRLKAR